MSATLAITHRPLDKRRMAARHPWWTRERVVTAMGRWHRLGNPVVTNCGQWHALTKGATRLLPPHRPYPSGATVLQHFRTLRQAWMAAGVPVDRSHEDFLPEEHWYIREAAGFVPRVEIARDLGRTPTAVKSYLRDHGLHSYRMHGWSLQRAEALTGLSRYQLDRYERTGALQYHRGSKCIFVQPVDLLALDKVNWATPHPELAEALRPVLMTRLVGILRAHVGAAE